MKKDNYTAIIEKLSNPDTFADALIDLSSQLDNDCNEYNKLVESNNNLRDTNSKLALRVTETVKIDNSTDNNDEDTPEKIYGDFINKLKSDLNKEV